MKKQILVLFFFVVNSVFASSTAVDIPSSIKNNVSFTILKAKSGNVVASFNGNTPRLVASNMKLVTTYIALEQLKSNFTWHTRLYYSGTIHKGVLNGQVYIKGGGDPTFTKTDLYNLLSQLQKLKIKSINGDVVVDENIFNSLPTYSMLKEEPYDSDTILPHGFMVDGDSSNFTLNIQNSKVIISSNLNGDDIVNKLTVNSKLTTCTDIYSKIKINLGTQKVVLSGEISPVCDGKNLEYSLFKHEKYLDLSIEEALDKLGIDYNQIDVVNVPGSVPQHITLITDHASSTLDTILYTMNHYSVNLMAESIFLSIGAYTTKNVDTYHDAKAAYADFMNEHELSNSPFKLENGAGLSRTEYLTTNGLASMLLDVDNSSLKQPFEITLPSPVSVGTLEGKFVSFGNRLQCKTGTLNDVKSYAGFFHSKTGQKYIVVFTVNGLEKNSNDFVLFDQYFAKNLMLLDKLQN